MNKRMNTLVTSISTFVCLLIVLINGVSGEGNYEKFDILAGIFSAFTINGIYYVVCAIIKKDNINLLLGAICLLIGGEGLIIKYGLFGNLVILYFLPPILVIALALIIRSIAANVSAYTADNEKPEYKSYRDRKAEAEANEAEENK